MYAQLSITLSRSRDKSPTSVCHHVTAVSGGGVNQRMSSVNKGTHVRLLGYMGCYYVEHYVPCGRWNTWEPTHRETDTVGVWDVRVY